MNAVPELDDQTFDGLVDQAIALLPRHAPAWTNHNPADPGITLIELLAYFTEMMVYRLDRVPARSRLNFLRLLRGPDWDGYEALEQASADEIDRAIRAAVAQFDAPQCAVTAGDFERLARQAGAAGTEGAEGAGVARALCVPGVDLSAPPDRTDAAALAGHVSVVVLPARDSGRDRRSGLVDEVERQLLPRCMIGTRLHVVEPVFLHVALRIRLESSPQAGRSADQVHRDAIDALQRYCSPYPGEGPDGAGWPFGKPLSVLELQDVLGRVPGVDSVRAVEVLQLALDEKRIARRNAYLGIQVGIGSTVGVGSRIGALPATGADRLVTDRAGRLAAVLLEPHELLRVHVEAGDDPGREAADEPWVGAINGPWIEAGDGPRLEADGGPWTTPGSPP